MLSKLSEFLSSGTAPIVFAQDLLPFIIQETSTGSAQKQQNASGFERCCLEQQQLRTKTRMMFWPYHMWPTRKSFLTLRSTFTRVAPEPPAKRFEQAGPC